MATKTKKKTTTKKPKVSSQSQTWANQAAIESMLQFQPQISVLEQAYSDAQDTYRQKATAAKSFNALQQQAIAQAAPAVDQSYGKTAQAQGAVNSLIHDQLGKLPAGDVSAPFQTAAMLGAGTAASNLLGEQANAKASFGQQAVQAAQGAKFQESSAQDELVSGLAKILGQRQDVARQQGAFTSLSYEKLHQAAQKLAHDTNITKANNQNDLDVAGLNNDNDLMTALIGQGIDPTTGKPIPGAKSAPKGAKGLLPGGAKPLTTQQQSTFIGNVKNLASLVKHQRGVKFAGVPDKDGNPQPMTLPDGTVVKVGQRLSDHAIRQLLTTKNNPTGKAYSHDEINAAFDVAVLGGLSPANVKALHLGGIKIQGRLPIKKKSKSKIAGLSGTAGPGKRK